MLLQSRKVAPHSSSPKLLFKVATEKLLPEAASKLVWKAVQSCSPKLLPILQSGSRKLRPKVATKSCSPKLLSKAIAPKLRFFKPISQNGSPKLFYKAAPESCSRKLPLESCSPTLFVKLPPKAAPKAAVLESKYSSKLFRKACQSCSLKRFPEAASQSYSPKYLCKAVAPKWLCFKPVMKIYDWFGCATSFPKLAGLCQRPFQCKVSGTQKTLVPTTSRIEISVGMTSWCLLRQAMLCYTRQNLICMFQIL